ncbi:MAG: UvrD-helicase domain-containing protein, partial [Microbacteriaceae bacterium]
MAEIAKNSFELSELLGEQYRPTAQQQRVIEAGLSPALVVAGAGSGKTTTMADRVAWLVYQGVNPEEILGLTFTRKATQELSARVHLKLKLLREKQPSRFAPGTEYFEPAIFTYNSFANSIFRDNALMVGREPESLLLDEIAAWTLARRVVIEFGGEFLGEEERALSTITTAVVGLSQAASQNQVQSSELRAYAEEFLQVLELPANLQRPKAAPTKKFHDAMAP